MNVFLAVVHRAAASPACLTGLPPETVAGFLPFSADSLCQSWASNNRLVELMVWSNQLFETYPPELIAETPTGAKTMAGYLISPDVGSPWEIGQVSRQVPFTAESMAKAGGAWALLEAGNDPPDVSVCTSLSNWMPVYWGLNDDLVVVSNRARAVQALLRSPIDSVAMAISVTEDNYQFGTTPWKNVRALAAGTRLVASQSGVRFEPTHDWHGQLGTRRFDDSALSDLVDCFLTAAFPASGKEIHLGLSAGLDSRLIAAVLTKAGHHFVAETRGFPESDDVVSAGMICQCLGIEHRHGPGPGPSSDGMFISDPLEAAELAVHQAEGLVNAYDSFSSVQGPATSIRMGGEGSSPLRMGYLLRLDEPWGDVNYRIVRDAALKKSNERRSLIRPRAFEWLAHGIDAWIAAHRQLDPLYLLELMESPFRYQPWLGPMISGRAHVLPIQLFMDQQVYQLALSLDMEQKQHDRVVFKIIEAIEPRLAAIPPVGRRWRFERSGPLPGNDESYRARTPIPSHSSPAGSFDWRRQWPKDFYDLFFEVILRQKSSDPLFVTVNRHAVEHWFGTQLGKSAGKADSRLAWSLFTAAVFLARESGQPLPTQTLFRIPVPKGTSG